MAGICPGFFRKAEQAQLGADPIALPCCERFANHRKISAVRAETKIANRTVADFEPQKNRTTRNRNFGFGDLRVTLGRIFAGCPDRPESWFTPSGVTGSASAGAGKAVKIQRQKVSAP
ncbi:MAG TPA: hypothetical protein VNN22_24755 [Verrucomicrobiae bacterium]|nr:hypothetical protein [Verrucomicrobiae bacterium]